MTKSLAALLEGFEDGQRVLVHLNNGNEFVLYDFEVVDESIYGRDDLILATIGDVVRSEFPYKNGTKLEFELGDIVSLSDPASGENIQLG